MEMEFNLPEEIKMLRDMVRKFTREELLPLEKEIDESDCITPELRQHIRKRAKEVGIYAHDMPEEYGGGGMGMLASCIIQEEVAKVHRVISFYPIILGSPPPILLHCNGEQRQKYLIPAINADKMPCFALTEPNAGSDAANINTKAVKDGGSYIINGLKHFISNGPYADFAIVFTLTDIEKRARGGITAFLVDKGTPGFSIGKIQDGMEGGKMQCELVFEDCRVPATNVLGKEGEGFKLALEWISHGRLRIGAKSLGEAERLLEMSVDYAKQRVQFGQPIAKNQAIQWMLADMAVGIYATRSMVYDAAWKADHGIKFDHEANMIKLFSTEMEFKAADLAMQIHGGMGYMKEFPIERLFRSIRSSRIGEGTSEIMRRTIARNLLGKF